MLFMNGALALSSMRLSSLFEPKQAIGLFVCFFLLPHLILHFCLLVS